MRTPLNAVIGLSELTLGLPSLSNEAKSNTEKVYNAGMTLLGIVNDILDLSKIEAGKLTITPVEYDLASVINDTATLNVIRIGSKPLKFNINIDGSLPAKLYGDDMRVKQIFNNLLSNAFKYTNEGAVDLYIECEHEGTSVILTVKVKDTGIGIAADSLAKIFSKYGQVNAQSNRKIEGTGLGLSITKQLATLMGGDITVESKLGEGSTFTVTIRQGFVSDVKLGDEVAANLASMQYIDGKRHRNTKLIRIPMPYARILVVDDMPTNLDVALGILRPYGMQVDCVTSGIKAIDLIRKAEVKYDAIFMDHMMPDMDGITATEIIRRDIGTEYAKTVPILALTANAIVGNEKMFLEHGFDAFLSKPIDILAMDAAIRKFIRHKDKEKEWAEIHGKSDIPVITPHDLEHGMFAALKDADLDVETALNRFDNDANVYAEILASYVKNTAPLLDILRAVTRESIHNYGVMVHGLKSSSRSIGAISIGERAEDLECAAKAKDFDFIRVNNGRFIERLDELIGHISKYLKKLDDSRPKKERKARPSAEVLDALLKACISFDVDEVDEAMTELEKYDYDGDAELVEWIHTQAEAINYKAIIEKLSQK
jgi:CheY-like chemotaxis protein/anti-sigma regulatory factor (Ser/Thr protein kinase)